MRRLQWLVWNRSERRLRAPWRLLLGIVFVLLVSVAALLALSIIRSTLGFTALYVSPGPTTRPLLLNALVGVVVVFSLVPIGWHVDRRRLSDYGLGIDREWWRDCGFGLVLGAGTITAVVLAGVAGGWFVVESVGLSTGKLSLFAGLMAVFVVVGIYEELLVRGYLLTNLAEGFRWAETVSARVAAVFATLISAVIFGGLHATNPNATVVSTVVISAAGVMLAMGYLYTGELAIPIGIHITWNAFQGLVYGLPVSGAELPVSLVETSSRGSEVVSGGAFGPEAGILGLAGILVMALGIVVYCRFQYGLVTIDPGVTIPDLRRSSTTGE